jgi:diadenosine tetraphosphate (Ap4A) HIT family hydrolase
MVENAQKGTHALAVCRTHTGWVVLGEKQVTHGYCLLLPDPVVPTLNALEPHTRMTFLYEMSMVGDVLLRLTGAVRVNYAIFGNLEPALHAHIVPRYSDEPSERRTQQPWAWDWTSLPSADPSALAAFIQDLRAGILAGLRHQP